jgi:D-alanyl-D-alanine carboxypeptidase
MPRFMIPVALAVLLLAQPPPAGARTQPGAGTLLDRKVQARSALLVDAVSGKVLFSRNPT